MNIKQKGPLFFLFALILGLLSYIYPGILTHPMQRIPSMGGDGIKNEFTYAYHILYGHGVWFHGMGYPFGEHIIFTDGQPILSIPLAELHHIIPFSADVAFAILVWCIVVSYLLAGYFLFRILIYQGVRSWLATLFAFFILFLSPQVFRVSGHFGLAYPCIIPMILYWLLCYHNLPKRKYAVYIGLLTVISGLLHLYFLATCLLIAGSYILYGSLLLRVSIRIRLRRLFPLVLAALVAFLLVQSFIFFTDPFKDRPQTPLGILGACTSLKELFTNSHSAIWQGLEEIRIGPTLQDSGEGLAYLGFIPLLSLIIGIISLGWVIRRKKSFPTINWLLPKPFGLIGIISITIALGIPFIWGLENVPEQLPLIRQFRALGRFNWPFYYIATLSAALLINHYYEFLRLKNKKTLSISLLIVAFSLWAIDVNGYIISTHNEGERWAYHYDLLWSRGEKSWSQYLQAGGYKADDFQAILMLPYFHIGTEKLGTGQEYDVFNMQMALGAKAALQLHLPIVDVMMSRSSWGIAELLNKLAAGPYAYKEVLNHLKDKRPLLLLTLINTIPNPDQTYLLQYADSIGHTEYLNIYALYPDRIRAADSARLSGIKPIIENNGLRDTCLGCKDPWFIQHSNSLPSNNLFFGRKPWPGSYPRDTPIAVIPLSLTRDSVLYECSVWTLTPSTNYRTPNFRIHGLDSVGHQLFEKDMPTKWAYDGDGSWFRASAWLTLPAKCKTLRVLIHKDESLPTSFALEELQLRPSDGVIISKHIDGRPMVNNHFYKLH